MHPLFCAPGAAKCKGKPSGARQLPREGCHPLIGGLAFPSQLAYNLRIIVNFRAEPAARKPEHKE